MARTIFLRGTHVVTRASAPMYSALPTASVLRGLGTNVPSLLRVAFYSRLNTGGGRATIIKLGSTLSDSVSVWP